MVKVANVSSEMLAVCLTKVDNLQSPRLCPGPCCAWISVVAMPTGDYGIALELILLCLHYQVAFPHLLCGVHLGSFP